MMTLSPSLTNKGTCKKNPVSTSQSLVALVAVFPFTAGSAFVTVNATFSGISTPRISPSKLH